MSKLLIGLRAAELGYPGAPVLHRVELAVHSGDFLAVVGDNGSGKTTLLRTLLGVLPVLSGSREALPGLRCSYVPQQLALDPLFPLSVLDVLRMGLWRGRRVLHGETAEERAFALSCLERVGMPDHRHHGFGQLSGGQKQRVLVARALAGRPELMLLDEPTSGVDAQASGAIHELLEELHQEGVAIVIVTHHPLALAGRADHAVLVEGGRVCARAVEDLLSTEGVAGHLL